MLGCTSSNEQVELVPEADISREPTGGLVTPAGLFDTKITSYWVSPPFIKICPSAGISKSRVRTAIGFWEDIGYDFGAIITQVSAVNCTPRPGEIVFRLPTQQEISEAVASGRLGVTKTSFHTSSRGIIMAEIYFQHQHASSKPKIVEHEIGHALGWRHHNRSGHIMFPTLEYTGFGTIGVDRLSYDKRIIGLSAKFRPEYDE